MRRIRLAIKRHECGIGLAGVAAVIYLSIAVAALVPGCTTTLDRAKSAVYVGERGFEAIYYEVCLAHARAQLSDEQQTAADALYRRYYADFKAPVYQLISQWERTGVRPTGLDAALALLPALEANLAAIAAARQPATPTP